MKTFPMATRLTANINVAVVVGERLGTCPGIGQRYDIDICIASNDGYFKAATRYPNDAGVATEILRFTPSFLHPWVVGLTKRRQNSI